MIVFGIGLSVYIEPQVDFTGDRWNIFSHTLANGWLLYAAFFLKLPRCQKVGSWIFFWTLKDGTLNGLWNDFHNIAHEIIITLSSGPDIGREEGEKT